MDAWVPHSGRPAAGRALRGRERRGLRRNGRGRGELSGGLPVGTGAAPEADPAAVGRAALWSWFAWGKEDARDRWVRTLAPKESFLLAVPVAPGHTLTGMHDLGVRRASGGAGVPRVVVTTLALAPGASPAHPDRVPLVPPETDPLRCRGVFPHNTRAAKLTVVPDGPCWVDLGGPLAGEHARPLPHEYEPARDPTGHANAGNYGVLYTLDVTVGNPGDRPLAVKCLLSAAGGAGQSVLRVDGAPVACPAGLESYQSWVFRELRLAPGRTGRTRIEFTLPGGTPGAQRLHFWPAPIEGSAGSLGPGAGSRGAGSS